MPRTVHFSKKNLNFISRPSPFNVNGGQNMESVNELTVEIPEDGGEGEDRYEESDEEHGPAPRTATPLGSRLAYAS